MVGIVETENPLHIDRLRPIQPTRPMISPNATRSLTQSYIFVPLAKDLVPAVECCVDVLRAANRLIGEDHFHGQIIEIGNISTGKAVCGPNDTLVLFGGVDSPWVAPNNFFELLLASIRSAARVCLVGSAVLIPLSSGMLRSKSVAVHAELRTSVLEIEPWVTIGHGVTCHHGTLSSAISPTSAIHMIVELVGVREGEYLFASLARHLGISERKSEAVLAGNWDLLRRAKGDPIVMSTLQLMFENLENPISIAEICMELSVSQRQIERTFRKKLNSSPMSVYRDMKLKRVRQLTWQTTLSFDYIAHACGFKSSQMMKQRYMRKFGETLDETRERALCGVER